MTTQLAPRLKLPFASCGWCVATVGLFSLTTPSPSWAQSGISQDEAVQISDGRDLPVREHLLQNGMRFLLLQRPGAPIVSFVAYVPVGSVNERPGSTGISHLLEHLLFKGTTTIGTQDLEAELELFERMDAAHDSLGSLRAAGSPDPEEIDHLLSEISVLEDSAQALVVPSEYHQIFARNGARGPNATTSYEATQYFVSIPSNRAELWFALEADRMRNPVFREFYSEKDVVMEERRTRVDTSPAGLLSAAQLDAAFRVHPYGRPPIGQPEDLRSLSRAQVQEYYRRYYGPEDTTVAMVGQFEADSAVVWAERYFGSIARGEPVLQPLDAEPDQLDERRVEVVLDARARIRVSWKIPPSTDPRAPAFSVLANILVGSPDARLHRRLIREEQIASSVFAGSGPGALYPGLFTIQAIPQHAFARRGRGCHLRRARAAPTCPTNGRRDGKGPDPNAGRAGETTRLL